MFYSQAEDSHTHNNSTYLDFFVFESLFCYNSCSNLTQNHESLFKYFKQNKIHFSKTTFNGVIQHK